ncbi:MAG: hypothetical protein KDD32_12450 [Bacteroidetes bacterium]|nr:hypothetical protein [Bacteroidota bacterium]
MLSPKEQVKNLLILHLGLLAGQVLILGILSIFVVNTLTFNINKDHQLLYVIGIIAVIGGLLVGSILFNQFKKKITSDLSLSQKLEQYKSAFIIRNALFEMGGMINIIFFAFIESNILFLAGAILIILIFFANIPNPNSIISHLSLTRSEGDQLI